MILLQKSHRINP